MNSETELVSRVLRGEPGAFEEFVYTFSRLVTAVLRRDMRLPPEDEDEVVQTVFQKILERDFRVLRQWRAAGSLGGYLKSITRSTALDWIRKRGDVVDPPDFDQPEVNLGPWPDGQGILTPEAQAARAELSRILHRAVEGLSERCRETIRLRFFEDMDYPEIADRLGKTVNNVRVTTFQCLRTLGEALGLHWGIRSWPSGVF